MTGRFLSCALLGFLTSCETSETVIDPVDPPPLEIYVFPGNSEYVTLDGGIPPYRILTYPPAEIATVKFVDSTTNPCYLEVFASPSATIGDTASFWIEDSSPIGFIVEGRLMIVTNHVSYADDVQPVWEVRCRSRGCHPGGGAPFSLESATSWQNLVNVPTSNAGCGALYRVVPFNEDSSLVYLLVSGKTTCPRMPLSPLPGDTLTQRDQDKIRTWILSGAGNN